MQTRRQKIHQDTREEIKSLAWEQIANEGASSLSLRAIATRMGLTSPALYRYFKSRDELATELIVEAYRSLGDRLQAAADDLPLNDHKGRIRAVGMAYRSWALTYPQRYKLIFGTPIPGYQAPAEMSDPDEEGSLGVLIRVIRDAWQTGDLQPSPLLNQLTPALRRQLAVWREKVGGSTTDEVYYLSLVCWARVHGLVWLEMFNLFPPAVQDAQSIYQMEISEMLKMIGFEEPI